MAKPRKKTKKKPGAPAKPEAPAKMGRPSSFSDRLVERLLVLASEGATDAQMAKAAGVGLRTLMTWKGRHPDFQHALKDAKDVADALVEASLYRRATGYEHPAVKFFCHEGRVVSEKYTERYPPDTTAAIFWLKNRQPDRWRDTSRHEHTGKDGKPIETKQVSVLEVGAAVREALIDAGQTPPSEDFR